MKNISLLQPQTGLKHVHEDHGVTGWTELITAVSDAPGKI
jgi:hypothetical protein